MARVRSGASSFVDFSGGTLRDVAQPVRASGTRPAAPVPPRLSRTPTTPSRPSWWAKEAERRPGTEYPFLQLEDITCPFQSPAIMDIKVGRVTFDPEASPEKRNSEKRKYPLQENLGFRLLGYRVSTVDGRLGEGGLL